MKQHPLAFVALTLFCTVGMASPKVDGNTITWPDDGYYQVQRASDYTSLCEGTASCEVADGTYIVINHSNVERFDDIVCAVGSAGYVMDESLDGNGMAMFPLVQRQSNSVPGTTPAF